MISGTINFTPLPPRLDACLLLEATVTLQRLVKGEDPIRCALLAAYAFKSLIKGEAWKSEHGDERSAYLEAGSCLTLAENLMQGGDAEGSKAQDGRLQYVVRAARAYAHVLMLQNLRVPLLVLEGPNAHPTWVTAVCWLRLAEAAPQLSQVAPREARQVA